MAAVPTDFAGVLTNIGFNAGARAVITGADAEDLDLPALAEFTTDSEVELFVDGLMGVPVGSPTYMYGDNMSVIHNTSKPESTLKKKSNSIAYHLIREAVAKGEVLTAYVPSKENEADILSKPLPVSGHWKDLVRKVLWDIYSYSTQRGQVSGCKPG